MHHRRGEHACGPSTTRSSRTASRPAPCSSPRPSPAATCTCSGAVPEHLDAVIGQAARGGLHHFRTDAAACAASGPEVPRPVDIQTTEHPGFPTDMQAQLMALMSVADGTERHLREHLREPLHARRRAPAHGGRHPGRGPHRGGEGRPPPLRRPGDGHGPAGLAPRCSSPGCGPRAPPSVSRVYHLDRGYERLERKLQSSGARTTRVKVKRKTGGRELQSKISPP